MICPAANLAFLANEENIKTKKGAKISLFGWTKNRNLDV